MGSGLNVLSSSNVAQTDFEPGKIYGQTCSGGQTLKIAAGPVLKNIVLSTTCKIQFGQGVILEDAVLVK